jgi:meiotically up-regulated gene 157 (Mug157) protein
MHRRRFLGETGILTAGAFLGPTILKAVPIDLPVVRVAKSERKFNSDTIEKLILNMKKKIKQPELGWLFENCFPNTLDTTVDFSINNGKPDTYVITGDIDAMWLRDSSAQVWPYLPFMKEDKILQQLIAGVIRRQTQYILLDPYANAFYKDFTKISEWKDDLTEMKPGIHERKWEVDSLCYPIRLAYGYWKQTGDTSVFDNEWKHAMLLIVKTFKEQQRFEGKGPYHFQRKTSWATDGVPMGGFGYPTKKIGLIHSMFRPSDDATVYPFLVPSNIFALYSLQQLTAIFMEVQYNEPMNDCLTLMDQLLGAISQHGIINHPQYGKIFAYEVDGFGNYSIMDDANIPSTLSLKYLAGNMGSPLACNDAYFKTVYGNSRKIVLSNRNPFFFKGNAAEGIGGPHVGMDYIWPMSIIMRAMTSTVDAEIKQCLGWLKSTHAGTGFMHESFHKDDPTKFTRKWFAWANTLFGELLLKITKERPHLV